MNAREYVCTMVAILSWSAFVDPVAQSPQSTARAAFPIPSSVRVLREITYARYGYRELKLDLYFPPEADQRRTMPAIIVVRGGGWRTGDKDAFGFIAGQLAKEGFVAASIEYRTSREAIFPAAVNDVKAAVRWMRGNAATYGIDPNALGAIGGSAGAHLVAMLATSAGVKSLEGLGGNAASSSEVQAVVAMACVCDLTLEDPAVLQFIGGPRETHANAITTGSPVTYVSSRSAPLLLLHSRTDPAVPFSQSAAMSALYRRAGAPVVLKAIEAPQIHAFWNDTRYFPETIGEAAAFFRKYLEK